MQHTELFNNKEQACEPLESRKHGQQAANHRYRHVLGCRASQNA